MGGLPASLKALVPRAIKRRLARLLDEHAVRTVRARASGGAFCMLGSPADREHFARIYLGTSERLRTRLALRRNDGVQAARRAAREHGLVVFAAPGALAALETEVIRLPRFVALSADTGDSDEALFRALPESARSDVRRIRREGYRIEIIDDPGWVQEFHARYHSVSIRRRHGGEGFVMDPSDMARILEQRGAEFLCVTLGGQRLGALLAAPAARGYRMERLGWLDGDPQWPARGVTAALYWFALQRARALGLPRVLMGGTPPYLEDGLFRFKSKWNPSLDPEGTRFGFHDLLLSLEHPRVHALLEQRSLLALDRAGRFVVYSAQASREIRLPASVRAGIAHWYQLDPVPGGSGWIRQSPLE